MTSVRQAFFATTVACALALAAAAASAVTLPPLNDPPTSEYRQGKFVWIDLVTADLPAAEKFYGALFDTTGFYQETTSNTYVPVSGPSSFYSTRISADLPFILVLLGVLGGIVAFGFIGVFVGPVLLAIGYALAIHHGFGPRPGASSNPAKP